MLATRWRQETYAFAQYFLLIRLFISLLVGFGPQSGRYVGPTGIFGDTAAEHAWASGGWLPC